MRSVDRTHIERYRKIYELILDKDIIEIKACGVAITKGFRDIKLFE